MKHLLSIAFVFALLGTTFSSAFATEKDKNGLEWYTDLMQANEKSKATKRPIFGFFTGSDWCGWCHKLQSDVFAKPEFVKWAKANVILLELDFPRRKQLPDNLVQQNNSLQQAFQVQGYPTIWIFNVDQDKETQKMNLTPYGSLGYPQGAERGKEEVKFLTDAKNIIAQSKAKK